MMNKINKYFFWESNADNSKDLSFGFHEFAYLLLMFGVVLFLQNTMILESLQWVLVFIENTLFVDSLFLAVLCFIVWSAILLLKTKK
jgi:hypothetical protein